MIRDRNVIRPDIVLPFFQAQYAAKNGAGVHADSHVHHDTGALSQRSERNRKCIGGLGCLL